MSEAIGYAARSAESGTFDGPARGYLASAMRMPRFRNETAAVGWLLVGVLLGIFLVFYAVFALIF